MKVKLNSDELDYLLLEQLLPHSLRMKLASTDKSKSVNYALEISENEADEIRNLCGEQLQVKGFDENYVPTKEGRLLESLIDKFFVP